MPMRCREHSHQDPPVEPWGRQYGSFNTRRAIDHARHKEQQIGQPVSSADLLDQAHRELSAPCPAVSCFSVATSASAKLIWIQSGSSAILCVGS